MDKLLTDFTLVSFIMVARISGWLHYDNLLFLVGYWLFFWIWFRLNFEYKTNEKNKEETKQ